MEKTETTVLSVDYGRAVRLDTHIKTHADLVQKSLYEVCKGLKEMRDEKLYKELGYKNFEEYCEKEVGLTYRQAYNFCLIAEKFSEENLKSISCIGTTKLSLLARLDEPQREEIVQKVDVESVTVKELKKKIAALEDDSQRKDKSEKQAWSKVSKLQTDSDMQKQKISQLESQVQELESRPVEVAVEKDTAEIERLTEQIEQERQKHQAELEKIKSENPNSMEIEKATFQAFFTNAADALRRLCDFTKKLEKSDNSGHYIRRIVALVEHAKDEIDE